MMAGFGIDRLARSMLEQAQAIKTPSLPDSEAEGISRVQLARAAGIEPDQWQRKVLESDSKKHLLLCSRQAGKSTVAGLLAVHEAITNPGTLVLMLAPAQRQSAELFRSCMRVLKSVDVPLPPIDAESALRVELANDSRIVALPGSEATTRGYAACSLLLVDEAARVSDDLYVAVTPSLATTDGRQILLTTGRGKIGFFYKQWTEGDGWERTRVTADDCPRISRAHLADQLSIIGPQRYAAEYMCEFIDADSAAFSSAMIERALTDDVQPLWLS